MRNIKSIRFKGFDLRLPFFTTKFEMDRSNAKTSGKANNQRHSYE
ncbi:hypothetical protein ACFWMP_15095 [Paenibacillus sp. NPDC058367]